MSDGLTEAWLRNALITGAAATSSAGQEKDPVVLDPADGLERVTKMRPATSVSPGAMPATRITQAQLNAYADALAAGASGTFGADKTTFDITGLACDTNGPFRATFCGFSKGTTSNAIGLRINGVVVSDGSNKSQMAGWYSTGGATPTLYAVSKAGPYSIGTPNRLNGIDGKPWIISIECPAPWSTMGATRQLRVVSSYLDDGSNGNISQLKYDVVYLLTDEIVSIGLNGGTATAMAAASFYSLVRL